MSIEVSMLREAIDAKNKDVFIETINGLEGLEVKRILRDTVETISTKDLMFVLECLPYDQLSALMTESEFHTLLGKVLQTWACSAFYPPKPNEYDKELDTLLEYLKGNMHKYLDDTPDLVALPLSFIKKGCSNDEARKNAVSVYSLIFKFVSREETLSFLTNNNCDKADSLFFKAALNNATVSRDGELVKKLLGMCTGGLCEEDIVEYLINKMPIEILSFPNSKLYKDFPKFYNRFITRMAEEGKLSLWNRLYLFFTGNFELAFSFPKLKAEVKPGEASSFTLEGDRTAVHTPETQDVKNLALGLGKENQSLC